MQTFWKNKITPKAPYYAVIFISEKNEDISGYEEMNDKTMETALSLNGCLGYSSVPSTFISYWDTMDSINLWRQNSLHLKAKEQGKDFVGEKVRYAIKADAKSKYMYVKAVLKTFTDMKIYRFNLITSLEGGATKPAEAGKK